MPVVGDARYAVAAGVGTALRVLLLKPAHNVRECKRFRWPFAHYARVCHFMPTWQSSFAAVPLAPPTLFLSSPGRSSVRLRLRAIDNDIRGNAVISPLAPVSTPFFFLTRTPFSALCGAV